MRAPSSICRPLRAPAVALLALAALLAPLSTGAQERIHELHSDIRIEPSGAMEVTETIRVRAEGDEIRRGIYRDFPTDYRDRLGNRYRVGFEMLSALRDGMAEPFREERIANGVRVYLGRADYFLPHGDYEYVLRYRTNRQLGFFDEHDELYWNVTGNGWTLPIDAASATVTLPSMPGLAIRSIEGYVGAQGSTERSYEGRLERDNAAFVRSTRPLRSREGLTLVATWPKGWIEAPTGVEQAENLLADNAGLLVALLGVGVLLAYLMFAWHRAGRDPERGVVFPHYAPPERFSPASVRFISRMGYDTTAFSAAVINLAVKGFLTIEENDGKYALSRSSPVGAASVAIPRAGIAAEAAPTGAAPTPSALRGGLAAGERALLESLFEDGDSVVLHNKNHRRVSKARRAHARSLERDYQRRYFLTNTVWLVPAVMILVVTVIGTFAQQPPFLAFVVLVLGAIAIPVFYRLLKAPTRRGRQLLDKVEGFKLYLELAEQEELNLRNPPEKTPALFETYLPFALALGVEQPWAEKFASVFAKLESATGTTYAPAWYHGHWNAGHLSRDIGKFTSDLSGSLNSAIAASATPPGSTSGAGGGSSGGGGGGGGGGGW